MPYSCSINQTKCFLLFHYITRFIKLLISLPTLHYVFKLVSCVITSYWSACKCAPQILWDVTDIYQVLVLERVSVKTHLNWELLIPNFSSQNIQPSCQGDKNLGLQTVLIISVLALQNLHVRNECFSLCEDRNS